MVMAFGQKIRCFVGGGEMQEYEDLIVKRDALVKEAGIMLTLYTNKFGELVAKVYEKKIECIKKKKTIAYCQAFVNKGEKIDFNKMNAIVSEEMQDFYEELQSLIENAEKCKVLDVSREFDVLKSKKLYRKIAKLIHPDVNPNTESDEELMDFFERAVEAYHLNEYQKLEEIYVLLCKMGIDEFEVEIENLEEKKDLIRREIEQIQNTEPYIYKYIIEDDEAVEEKISNLNEEYESYEKYLKELDLVLRGFVAKGVVVEWEENS